MLYTSNQELPLGIRDKLSQDYQDLYRAAFNSAIHWYGEEAKAHQVARSAVKMYSANHLLGVMSASNSPNCTLTPDTFYDERN
ncbi:MAG: ChaB family protein [Scytonematopsis contorta HA4267-MV1]|jgi:cation transport regulator|nr:ChaB family protein [Scytonematopsis contorta HA4267-MV1]